MSYGITTWPPAVGGLRLTPYCVLLAGADAMFLPLVPSRFSAPQLIAEPGSPAAAFAAPYEIVTCSPAGPWWFCAEVRIQISPVWVVAFEKFFTPAKSTTIQVLSPSLRTLTRIVPPPPAVDVLRSVQNGATTLFGRAALGNVCGKKFTSAPVPPPSTTYPFVTTPIR